MTARSVAQSIEEAFGLEKSTDNKQASKLKFILAEGPGHQNNH